MSFEKIAEQLIQEAQEQGSFENLPGKGKPLALDEYFAVPEDMRLAHSILKNARIVPAEIELLSDIGRLSCAIEKCITANERKELVKLRDEAQLKLNLLLEERKRRR